MKCSECKFLKSYQEAPGLKYRVNLCGLTLPPQYEKTGSNRIFASTVNGCDLGQRDEGIPEFEKVFDKYDIPDYVK